MEDRQRSQADKSGEEEVFAPGSAIDSNLKQLAERRTDIFGIGTEETQIGKKVSQESVVFAWLKAMLYYRVYSKQWDNFTPCQ